MTGLLLYTWLEIQGDELEGGGHNIKYPPPPHKHTHTHTHTHYLGGGVLKKRGRGKFLLLFLCFYLFVKTYIIKPP